MTTEKNHSTLYILAVGLGFVFVGQLIFALLMYFVFWPIVNKEGGSVYERRMFLNSPATPERIKEAVAKCSDVGLVVKGITRPLTNYEINLLLEAKDCGTDYSKISREQKAAANEAMNSSLPGPK